MPQSDSDYLQKGRAVCLDVLPHGNRQSIFAEAMRSRFRADPVI